MIIMRSFLGLLALLISSLAFAQPKDGYDDLMLLYLDGSYEKLLSKAEKYASDPKTRKDPVPLLYASKALYEMSKLEEFAEDYPPEKALRSSLKWASKYRKKDKDGSLYSENEVYFEELKEAAVEEAESNMMENNFSKAKRYYDSITDFDPEDAGAWIMLGYCNLKINNQEGKAQIKTGGELAVSRDLNRLWPVEKRTLKFALITYSMELRSNGMRDSARTVINYGYPLFQENKEFMMMHGELN